MQNAAQQLSDLLATLRAVHFIHWTGHWQVKGNPYYGDHLLLQRLYEGLDNEIDTLAEKLVAMFGVEIVNPAQQSVIMNQIIQSLSSVQNPIMRSLNAEKKLMRLLEHTFKSLEKQNNLSLGMNDFIAATANAHETYIYLLQQRTR
tara:strand:- start:4379 stop:4816 length:438 start_codon:yes stop_codon:yes gene_type:complete